MVLEVNCEKCFLVPFCTKKNHGVLYKGIIQKCRILGGYGKEPVEISILSKESLELYEKNGKCLSIVEVPFIFNGSVQYETFKVFHIAYKSDRESTNTVLSSDLTPKSHR